MDFFELAANRYSCRKFSDKPVEQDKIDRILKAALLAPTAHNYQPFHIWVINDEASVGKLSSITKNTFGAKLFFVVGGRKDEGWIRSCDQRNFQDVDASIVATHMMLAVTELGLGTTWVGNFNNWKLETLFPEMSDYDLVAIFPVGYPADTAKPAHLHTERKDLSKLVTFVCPAEEKEEEKA
ncbi:MAG: nitroreductase family protein [Lachnospiraceae bacterium]|nr:nitroreductase family protein [Lachnospiraceae bacterium]